MAYSAIYKSEKSSDCDHLQNLTVDQVGFGGSLTGNPAGSVNSPLWYLELKAATAAWATIRN